MHCVSSLFFTSVHFRCQSASASEILSGSICNRSWFSLRFSTFTWCSSCWASGILLAFLTWRHIGWGVVVSIRRLRQWRDAIASLDSSGLLGAWSNIGRLGCRIQILKKRNRRWHLLLMIIFQCSCGLEHFRTNTGAVAQHFLRNLLLFLLSSFSNSLLILFFLCFLCHERLQETGMAITVELPHDVHFLFLFGSVFSSLVIVDVAVVFVDGVGCGARGRRKVRFRLSFATSPGRRHTFSSSRTVLLIVDLYLIQWHLRLIKQLLSFSFPLFVSLRVSKHILLEFLLTPEKFGSLFLDVFDLCGTLLLHLAKSFFVFLNEINFSSFGLRRLDVLTDLFLCQSHIFTCQKFFLVLVVNLLRDFSGVLRNRLGSSISVF